jgi:flagellar export protein FliJ
VAAFRFRLASVLRYRERKREDKRLELREVEQAQSRLRGEIERLEARLERLSLDIEDMPVRPIAPVELRLGADFSQALSLRIRECRRLLAEIDSRASAKRAELLEANREVKTLEQLRERRRERHRLEESRAEQKLTDEAGQRGSHRQ